MAQTHQKSTATKPGVIGMLGRVRLEARAGSPGMESLFHASNLAAGSTLAGTVSRVKFPPPTHGAARKFHASNRRTRAGTEPAGRGGQTMPPPK